MSNPEGPKDDLETPEFLSYRAFVNELGKLFDKLEVSQNLAQHLAQLDLPGMRQEILAHPALEHIRPYMIHFSNRLEPVRDQFQGLDGLKLDLAVALWIAQTYCLIERDDFGEFVADEIKAAAGAAYALLQHTGDSLYNLILQTLDGLEASFSA